MRAYERLLEYVRVGTASSHDNPGGKPSTQGQLVLANRLVSQLCALGFSDARVDERCYVYAGLPASPGCEGAPAIGFIAHLDTSPDCPGDDVRPLLHSSYNGGAVTLPSGFVIDPATFPQVRRFTGETLITASGGTLLGADDKAGIAEILTAMERVGAEGRPHGPLCVAFTPDEEIGMGADGFDIAGFGAQFAYTVDGGPEWEVVDETFSAAGARVQFTGVEVHPGDAKDIMVNALGLAMAYDALLPADERPQYTDGRQGFYHLTDLCGTVGSATAQYILRDHDETILQARKQIMRDAADALAAQHPGAAVELTITDSYRNMADVMKRHPHLTENAMQAVRAAGMPPRKSAARGGTDGSMLSHMGLPCPNLGTGGACFHGQAECISAEAMDRAVEVILGVIDIYAKLDKAALEADNGT